MTFQWPIFLPVYEHNIILSARKLTKYSVLTTWLDNVIMFRVHFFPHKCETLLQGESMTTPKLMAGIEVAECIDNLILVGLSVFVGRCLILSRYKFKNLDRLLSTFFTYSIGEMSIFQIDYEYTAQQLISFYL